MVLLEAMAPSAHAYTHPCVPLTSANLATIKTKVQAGAQPWKSGYDAMAGDWTSAIDYVPRGAQTIVSRNPNINLTDYWRPDMIAAYNQARMWWITGNTTYAAKARTILINWATTQTSFGGIEANLDLGDYAVCYVGAADILRSTYSGWSASDTTTFQNFLKTVYWPALGLDGDSTTGPTNKGSLSLAAGAAIAAFCDDTTLMNRVIYHLRYDSQTGFINTLSNGEHGETGRDSGHAGNHILAMAFVAQVLWNTGTDVFSYYNNALLSMGEYYSRFQTGTSTPYVPMGTTDEYYTTNWSSSGFNAETSMYNILKTAYSVRKGMQTPWMDQDFDGQSQTMNSYMYLLPSDSSTASALGNASLPSASPTGTGLSNSEIGGSTPSGSGSYSGGTWTVTGGGTDIWTHGSEAFHYVWKQVTGDFSIIARVVSVQSTHPTAKAGLMVRSDLNADPDSKLWVALTPSNTVESYMDGWTEVYGGSNWESQSYGVPSLPYWLKIERVGQVISAYASQDGTSWAVQVRGKFANTPSTVYIGLAVDSMVNGTLNTSTFDHVNMTGGSSGATVIPYAPAAVYASPGLQQVPLRWTASFGATTYAVDRAPSGGSYTSIAQVSSPSYIDTNISGGTTYNYKIRAGNSAGWSGDSMVVSVTPSAPLIANGTYKVINRNSGKALDVTNAATIDGSLIDQWPYSGSTNQRWTFTHLGNNVYKIVGVGSSKSLDVNNGSSADGANVIIWTSNSGDNQKWKITSTGSGYYKLEAVHSGKSLDVNNGSSADGAAVIQWLYSGGLNQQWSIAAP